MFVATSFDSLLARREIYWMMRFAVREARGNCARQQAPATDRVLQVVVLLFERRGYFNQTSPFSVGNLSAAQRAVAVDSNVFSSSLFFTV